MKSDGTLWALGDKRQWPAGGRHDHTANHADTDRRAVTDDFETNTLTKLPWSTRRERYLDHRSSTVHGGTYAAKAPTITHNQSADMQATLTCAVAGTISFWYLGELGTNYDYLRFYIDGVQQGAWSGTVPWTQASFAVSAGSHTFKWEYAKDVTVSAGSDTAWIDDIVVSSNSWVSVAAGQYHKVAIRGDSTLWAWGYNGNGQLGLGNTTQFTSPQQIGRD